ncbi:MAG: hypothetical protein HYV28_08325 [Ignavibacteriales bacterium]|nr:hypothetical protein [Ignavibacteriales bacterium]
MQAEKNRESGNGFTLFETLIGINLSFILVTAVFGFYLLTVKFSSAVRNGVENHGQYVLALNGLTTMLNTADRIYLGSAGNKTWIYSQQKILIDFSASSINCSGEALFNKPDSFMVHIRFINGTETLLQNGREIKQNTGLLNGDNTNSTIDVIHLFVYKSGTLYNWYYAAPSFAVNRFVNTKMQPR